jgi:hypothetical protein
MEKRGILTACPECKGRVAYGIRTRAATADEQIEEYRLGVEAGLITYTETYAWCKSTVNCGWVEE